MGSVIPILVGTIVAIPLLVVAVVFIIAPIFKAVGWVISRVFRFVGATIVDLFRMAGIFITSLVYIPLVVMNVIFGRWSRAQHFGRALQGECGAGTACLYRLAIGHPVRLFGAECLVEGLEKRVPQAVANAPPGTGAELRRAAAAAGGAVSSARAGQFPGYQVIGTLPGGGSGGRLYVARPDATKLAALARQGFGSVGDVVVKSFSMGEGSALPQIVRENRALEAARRLGLVLEHELTNERFFYVMRYVPGDSLGVVTPRLHAAGGGGGLPSKELGACLGYACDLLGTLHEYHKAGLWHKDVKPDNIIVSGGHAHLVDFGLITPLRSSMTLTTHGTEYFRDPEMVRLALRGVKVHEVDGAKFDIYAAGAVLYSMIENSFPAHGGLSQLTRTCPEALRWIVRRAMTDYDKRYATVSAMLADLVVVHQAALRGDATSVRPADLPSVKAGEGAESLAAAVAGPDGGLPHAPPAPPVGRWHGAAAVAHAPAAPMDFGVAAARTPRVPGRSAKDQVAAARGRAAEMRRRASARLTRTARVPSRGNFGVALASLMVVMAVGGGLAAMFSMGGGTSVAIVVPQPDRRVDDSVRGFELASGESAVFAAPVPPVPAEPARAGRADRARPTPTTSRGNRSKAPAPLPTPGQGHAVLIMQEPVAVGASDQAEIRGVLERVGRDGFAIISATQAPEGVSAETYVDLAGDLRNVVGLRTPELGETGRLVVGWLGQRQEVDAVLWITNQRNAKDRLIKLVFTRDDAPPGLLEALCAAARVPAE